MNRIAEEVEDEGLYLPAIARPAYRAGARLAPMPLPRRRGKSPKRSTSRRSSAGPRRGRPACGLSRERPRSPIVAISPIVGAGRKLSLVWGIHCVVAEDARDQDDMVGRACEIACKEEFAKAGERVIIVAGVPLRHARRDQHDKGCLRSRRRKGRQLAGHQSIGRPGSRPASAAPLISRRRRQCDRRRRGAACGRSPGAPRASRPARGGEVRGMLFKRHERIAIAANTIVGAVELP